MKMPWALRLDLIIAVLRGRMLQVSYFDGTYQFDIPSSAASRWRRRNERRKIKELKRERAS